MGAKTTIEWTRGDDGTPGATWNPVTGCTKVSAGCDHCYAETLAERFRGTPGHYYEHGFDVQLRPDKLDLPLRWRKPRRVFVNSMSDLFHDQVPDDYIARVFAVMAAAPRHTFQVLTKRHARMRSLLSSHRFWTTVALHLPDGSPPAPAINAHHLPNVWLGVSVEDQRWADIRVPALLETPAAVRFLSCEPLLGPVDLTAWTPPDRPGAQRLGWVIVGGESGHGARPMHPAWAQSLRDQCAAAGVPFLFKQWGSWAPTGHVGMGTPADPREQYVSGAVDEHGCQVLMRRMAKHVAGRQLDGRTHDGYPEAVA